MSLQRYTTEIDAMLFPVERVPIGIVPASGPLLYLAADADAELQRHKTAIQFLLQGQLLLRDGRLVRSLGGPYEAPIHVPPDIADLIKGEK